MADEIPCGSMMNAGTKAEPDVQMCVRTWPHAPELHLTADGEQWDENDPRLVGF